MTDTEKLQTIIDGSRNIVFFGGAGVSTESGIPDFRSGGGLYSQKYDYPPETVVSRSFFMSHTEQFYRFYKERMLYPDARPCASHIYLSELEKAGKLKAVITQNIDGLHRAAGSVNVMELHGSAHRNTCMSCGRKYPLGYILASEGVPRCEKCGGLIKPDVVLYGEPLDGEVVSAAIKAIGEADTLIVAGTSLTVYPAAGFIDYFGGDTLVVINTDSTPADGRADLVIRAPIGEIFSRLHV